MARKTLKEMLYEAKTVGIVNPHDYFLPPMALIATAVNPVCPLALNEKEFEELEQLLDHLKDKITHYIDERFVYDYIIANTRIVQEPEHRLRPHDGWILTAGELPLSLLYELFHPGPDVIIGASDPLIRFIASLELKKNVLPVTYTSEGSLRLSNPLQNVYGFVSLDHNATGCVRYCTQEEVILYFDEQRTEFSVK